MSSGFIKLHRTLLESAVFQSEGLFKVWIWCLLKASFKGRVVPMTTGRSTTEVELKPGQFIFGRKKAADELHMKAETVRDRMKKLTKLGNITMKPTTHYTIVTIYNWSTYQKDEKKDRQPTTNQTPTNRHKQERKEGKETLLVDKSANNGRLASKAAESGRDDRKVFKGEDGEFDDGMLAESARPIARAILKAIPLSPNRPRDENLVAKVAVLVVLKKISEHNALDAAEAVKQTRGVKKPWAYFFSCLKEKVPELKRLLATTRVPKTLCTHQVIDRKRSPDDPHGAPEQKQMATGELE